jgi:hypothetical protein
MIQIHHVSGSHLTARDRQAIRAIAEKGWTHGKTARKAYALQRDETGFKILLRSCLSADDVLELCRKHGWYSYEIAEGGNPDASARLIAAAPDMLAALRRCLDEADLPSTTHAAVSAAIAKAKGKTA